MVGYYSLRASNKLISLPEEKILKLQEALHKIQQYKLLDEDLAVDEMLDFIEKLKTSGLINEKKIPLKGYRFETVRFVPIS